MRRAKPQIALGLASGILVLLAGCPRPDPAAEPQPPNPDVRASSKATYDLELPAEDAEKHQLPTRCRGEVRAVYEVKANAGVVGRCRYTGHVTVVALRPDGNGEAELASKKLDGEVEGSTAEGVAAVTREGLALVAKYRGAGQPK